MSVYARPLSTPGLCPRRASGPAGRHRLRLWGDGSGRLINGQHRLKAIARSETSAPCLVVWNLEPDAFKISDVGVKRSGADVLRIEGFKNPQELAATCRLIALWKQGRLEEMNRYENVENSVVVDVAETCNRKGERLNKVIEMCNRDKSDLNGKENSVMPRSLMAFAFFAFHPAFKERTEDFYNGFVHQSDWPAENWEKKYGIENVGNPVNQLRDKVGGVNYDKTSRKTKLGCLIKALNYYVHEDPHKRLRYREDQDHFPSPDCPYPDCVPPLGGNER